MLNFLPATLRLAGAALVINSAHFRTARYLGSAPSRPSAGFRRTFHRVSWRVAPNFWLAVFTGDGVFGVSAMATRDGLRRLAAIILPAVSIAFMSLAINARLLRASILDVAGQRPVTWARLRGLNDKRTERRHILRNASLPMITAVGMHIGELIGRTMIIENIFAWPGVGRYAVSAIF